MARQRISNKMFRDAKGELHNRVGTAPDVDRVEFHFFDGKPDDEGKPTTGTVIGIDLSEVPGFDKRISGVARMAIAHGVAQKVGDEYSKTDGPADAIGEAEAMIERIKAGEWLTEREGGSSRGDTIFRQALVNVLSASGKDVSEETETGQRNLAKIDAILEDKEAAKKWKARPDVKEQIEAIKLERQRARAEKAREAAGESEGAELEGFE